MLKKILLFIVLPALLVVALPMTILVIAPGTIMGAVGNYFLADYAIKIELLEVSGLSFSALQIEEIKLVAGDDESTISLSDTKIDFHLSSLFNLAIDNIHISRAEVSLPNSKNQREAVELEDLRSLVAALFADDSLQASVSEVSAILNAPMENPLLAQLEEIEILDLSIASILHSAHLTANLSSTGVVISLVEDEVSLLLEGSSPAPDIVSATIVLAERGKVFVHMDASLSVETQAVALQTSARIDTEKLLGFLHDADFIPPMQITPSGDLNFEANFLLNASSLAFTAEIGEGSDLALDLSGLTTEMASVSLSSADRFEGEFQFDDGQLRLETAQVELVFSALFGSRVYAAEIQLRNLQGNCHAPQSCSLAAQFNLLLPELTMDELELKNIRLQSPLQLTWLDDQITMQSLVGSSLLIDAASTPTVTLENVKSEILEVLELQLDLTTGDLVASIEALRIEFPVIKFPGIEMTGIPGSKNFASFALTASQISLTRKAALQLKLAFSTEELDTTIAGLQPLSPQVRGYLQILDQQIEINAALSVANHHLLEFVGSHNIEQQQGRGSVVMDGLEFDAGANKLSNLFHSWPYAFNLLSGGINFTSQLRWQFDEQWTIVGPVELSLGELSGFYEKTVFSGLQTNINGQLLPSLQFQSRSDLRGSADHVDIGLPISDIEFIFALDSEQNLVNLHHFSAQLMKGKFVINDFAFDTGTSVNTLEVEFHDIDLSEIAALVNYPGVMQGLISGTLPLLIDGNTITMDKGTLMGDEAGGIISYQPGSGNSATLNPTLQLVNDALSNYHYESLQANANYDSNGNLIIEVKLIGNNPDMNEGQAINLNVHISDNIPSLLRSLQATRTIIDSLERILELQ